MGNNANYKNRDLSPGERAAELLKLMTPEEKVGQLCQLDANREDIDTWVSLRGAGSVLHILGEDCNKLQQMALKTRLGIPLLFGIDAIHGNAFWPGATVFPSQLALASSWETALIEDVARCTAKETAVTGAHWTFSPVICLARDLRWGRIDETFGEDSFLIGEFGKAMVRGYQGDDVSDPEHILACAKHFAGYSETQGGRDSSEADLSRRKLLTYFLPPFAEMVKAGCRTFMAGYESIDGTPCSASKWLLTEILRREWGFNGFVVSDWDSIGRFVSEQSICEDYGQAARSALEAGNDMVMSTPEFYEGALSALTKGILAAEYIDTACLNILKSKFELGLFDGKKLFVDSEKIEKVVLCSEHKDLALEAAYKSIVLLKNEQNILPLSNKWETIAVIGPNAHNIENQLGDWSYHSIQMEKTTNKHSAENITTVLQGLQQRSPENCRIRYARGCDTLTSPEDNIEEAVNLAGEADLAILVLGDDIRITGEKQDRGNLDLPGRQQELFDRVAATGTPVVVVLINSKPHSIPLVAEKASGILEAWNPGIAGGLAVAGILYGDRSPEGKLTISFPYHVGQQPVYYNQIPGWHAEKYVDMPKEPLYSFGYGLTYTSFTYTNMQLKTPRIRTEEDVEISVDLENSGSQKGTEIVQLYSNDVVSSVTTPCKELKAYQKVSLAPGEKRTVTFSLPGSDFALINSNLERIVEPGEFHLMVGSSSRDEDLLKATLRITA